MDMNGEESEDSDDSEDSQTETADTETVGKDSSRKEVKNRQRQMRLRLPHKTLDSNPSFHTSSEGKKIHQLEAP